MTLSFGINGLGRIGRALARVARERASLRLAAVNDVAPLEALVPLLRRDSVHGAWSARVEAADGILYVDGRPIAVSSEADPTAVPWPEEVSVVVEASGAHDGARASGHLRSVGPRLVVVSALVDGVDATVCQGVPGHEPAGLAARLERPLVVSNTSCTTHCLALLLRVLHESFGVASALMDETHGYTGAQELLDATHPIDPRRGRAAALNIVPTYSAAPAAAASLLDLEGRIAGRAVRVPTPNVALLDVVARLERPANAEALRDAFRAAAVGPLAGLLGVVDDPVVSTDLLGDPRSAIVDLGLIQSAGELIRVSAWYDNEWGYAHRLADLLTSLAPMLASREAPYHSRPVLDGTPRGRPL